ncbi:MAG: ABC transporter permease [Natronospirillum sp.]
MAEPLRPMTAVPPSGLRRVLAWFPILTAGVFVLPVVVGLLGTWLPAFGYLPVLGARDFGFSAWAYVFQHPSLPKALFLSVWTAWASTLLCLIMTLLILSLTWDSRSLRGLRRSLSALLAVPHAAFAIGIAALIAPSGWLLKLVSPSLTGFDLPPNFSLVKDPWGISLMLVLTLKEAPFVLFMALAALNQLQVDRSLRMARSLGYSAFLAWWRVIIPQLLPLIRLPMFAVLAYGLSVVDMAMILGPNAPPTLAILVHRWFNSPDILLRLPGSAGATLLLVVTLVSLLLWWMGECGLRRLLKWRLTGGRRTSIWQHFTWPAVSLNALLIAAAVGSFLVLLVWSFAFRWSFPDALPEQYSTRFWVRGWNQLLQLLWLTLYTGLAAAVIGLVLVVGCLEHEVTLRRTKPHYNGPRTLWLVYVPLIVPQIAFLFGVQVVLVWFSLDGHWLTLLWSHLMFVVPYIFLSLSGPYRSFDDRYLRQATLLRGSELRALWQVKWPMLLRPLLYVSALAFAVSLAQYLPTLYVGAGRFATITTETVNIASGGDRRIVAVYALFQWLAPMVIYSLALIIPAWRFRHRRAMQLGT